MTALWVGAASLTAAEGPKAFEWNPPKVTKSMFTGDLGLLDAEREEYASDLATYVANQIATTKASAQSLTDGRQILALALHLSPRNKRAIVLNFQLGKGMLPEATASNYSPQVFARLLLTRGQLLEKQGGDENKRLARLFVQLAARIDPKNEDAVYASEVHRLDLGPVNWSDLTDPAVVVDKPDSKPVDKPDSKPVDRPKIKPAE